MRMIKYKCIQEYHLTIFSFNTIKDIDVVIFLKGEIYYDKKYLSLFEDSPTYFQPLHEYRIEMIKKLLNEN